MLFRNLRHGSNSRRTVGNPHCISESLIIREFVGGNVGPSYSEAYRFYMNEFRTHIPQGGFCLVCGFTLIATAVRVFAALKTQNGFFHDTTGASITAFLAAMCLLCGYGWLMPRREAHRFARYACGQTDNVRTAYARAVQNGICADI